GGRRRRARPPASPRTAPTDPVRRPCWEIYPPPSVADLPEAQAVRRGDPAGGGPVLSPQHPHDLAGPTSAGADVDERPDDGPHHLPAEGASPDLEPQDAVARVDPAALLDPPHRGRAGRACPAEGGEVVLADERVGRQLHRLEPQRPGHPPGVAGQERVGD